MKITEKALQLSLELFTENFEQKSGKEQYHFSFLFLRNKIISIGENSYELSNKALYFANRFNVPQKKSYPYLHSEIASISKLWGRYRLDKKVSLVNIRLLRSGGMGCSKPCSDCKEVLNALGISEIYWSTPNGFISDER